MVDNSNAPSGSNQTASGTPDNNIENKPSDMVAYDSYKKAVEEAKNAKAKLRELESKEKERTEAELKQKEEFKKLFELRENELNSVKAEKEKLEKGLQNGLKVRSVLDAIKGEVEQQYWDLFELDKVTINPETNTPDPMSVEKYAREFETKYSLVIKKANGARLPNDAPRGGNTKLTHEEFSKLSAKEQRKRLSELD